MPKLHNLREASQASGWSQVQIKRFCQEGRIRASKQKIHPGTTREIWMVSSATITQLKRWRVTSIAVTSGRSYAKKKKEETEE